MRTIRRTLATAGLAVALALPVVLTPVPAIAVVVDGIAAVVNGEVITLLELEKAGRLALEDRLRTAPADERERLRRLPVTVPGAQSLVTRLRLKQRDFVPAGPPRSPRRA